MSTWFLTNILISSFALFFIWTNRSSPSRLRFCVSFAALCAWLIPWNFVDLFSPTAVADDFYQVKQIFSSNLPGIPETGSSTTGITTSIRNAIPAEFQLTDLISTLVAIATLVGVLAFLFFLYRQQIFLSRMRKNALPGNYLLRDFSTQYSQITETARVEIFIQDISPGAMYSGILFPKIWIHRELINDATLPAILLHELNHVKQHDNFYLALITFIEKILWWNPLVQVLSSQTRILQELSCDEACAERMPEYRARLSSLILANQNQIQNLQASSLSSNILKEKSFNVLRIKLLEKRCVMKFQHALNLFFTVCAVFISVNIVNAQSSEFSLNEFEQDSLVSIGASEGFNNGEMINISYMAKINKNAEFSMYYPDAHLITILTAMVDMQRRLKVRRNLDKITGEAVPDTEYALRMDVAETLNIGSSKINDTDAYGILLPSGRFEDLSLQETLSILSEHSKCTIVKQEDAIVVDKCNG